MPTPQQFTKVDMTPKRHHGYSVILFIMGTLFPPLAVAARFGLGLDFWLNLFLTIAGYIPGHVHNFYIQNVRNNKNNNRTPKWIQKYGLVNTDEIKRKQRRSQWAGRYQDRLPRSTLEGRPYEEGQEGGSSVDISTEDVARPATGPNGELWNPEEEQFYGQKNRDSGSIKSSRWHYPANFDDTTAEPSRKKSSKKKKDKKDRWARTEDAYSIGGVEDGPSSKKKSKSKKRRTTTDASETYSNRSGSTTEFPEDVEGGLYRGSTAAAPQAQDPDARRREEDDLLNQEV
ncbi:hypothetical protein EUX98_g6698 [Antrodiella citrinella]|uniref:Stress response RCI peptide n=1 Tax=Antrodiella citrinella TaxID=2447956 RepID=A0A4S4MP65_9APHY|nr:hypothetical protein EUX98_g6698 [Antrodiella citrinella]